MTARRRPRSPGTQPWGVAALPAARLKIRLVVGQRHARPRWTRCTSTSCDHGKDLNAGAGIISSLLPGRITARSVAGLRWARSKPGMAGPATEAAAARMARTATRAACRRRRPGNRLSYRLQAWPATGLRPAWAAFKGFPAPKGSPGLGRGHREAAVWALRARRSYRATEARSVVGPRQARSKPGKAGPTTEAVAARMARTATCRRQRTASRPRRPRLAVAVCGDPRDRGPATINPRPAGSPYGAKAGPAPAGSRRPKAANQAKTLKPSFSTEPLNISDR